MDSLKKRRCTASDPDTQTVHAEVLDSDLLHPRKVQMDYRKDPQLSQWFRELIVPISYLERYFHQKATDSAVTKFRTSFNQSLRKALEDHAALKESFEIKEPT